MSFGSDGYGREDMMNDQDIADFEASVQTNGDVHWSARQFAAYLGYADYRSFRKVLDRAIGACMRLNIPVAENFSDAVYVKDGQTLADTQLSRFACYLVAMNADARKERVAKAQVYLAALANTFRELFEAVESVDRVVVRGDIADQERGLAATANDHAVTSYAFFQNAGYRGMYNMNLKDLRHLKGVPENRSPLDFMYSTELAANLFRITQTKEKIQNQNITGQAALERAATQVGQTVRQTMIEISGTKPEDLPPAEDIKDARARLKGAHRNLKELDTPFRG